jgi:N utilization substance protein A
MFWMMKGMNLLLPKTEQIPSDFFKKGDSVKAVVYKVELKNGTPSVIVFTSFTYVLRAFI